MMHKSDDPTPRDCDEYIAALVAFDGDSQAALFAHCASLSVNAVHEPWNRSPRRLAAAVQVPAEWHGSSAAQSTGFAPVQTPAWQLSA